MGLLSGLFKGKTNYPELSSDVPIAGKFESVKDQVSAIMSKYNDKVEVAPSDDRSYVYIGNPPKVFGFAWILNNEVKDLKEIVQEKNFAPMKVERIIKEMRAAYEKAEDAPKYTTTLNGKTVIVTDSAGLCGDLKKIVEPIE